MQYMKLALLAALCALAVGCTAAKQDTAVQTASMEWRVQSLEESFLNFKEKQRLQADKADEKAQATEKKITALEAEVAALKDGVVVKDAPDDMVAKKADDKGWVTDLKPDDAGWVEGQKGAEKSVAQSGEAKPWAKVPGPPAVIPEPKVVERKKAAPKKTTSKKKAPAKKKVMGSESMYNAAYAKYTAGDFEGARGAFDEFLKKYPKSSLTPNALYWKGETYYSQKNYPQAILTFKEVTGRYPKHSKSAAALLKIGMSYDKVGDTDNAIFYLRALVEDFPKSSPAKLGRKELTRLGG